MSGNKMGLRPNLTFVSITGPTLDDISAKTMRAHTTRANFARRRLRLMREYNAQKERAARIRPLQVEEDGLTTDRDQLVDIQLPILSHPCLDGKLSGKDAFFINHLTQAMGKLHLVTNIPASDTARAIMQSDWARFLPDPTMLDVSLYFARHVYAARRQHPALQFDADAYRGEAIRSVRERLNDANDLSDSFIAAILILTVLDQVLGNIEAWKIHISGLLQIITVRSRNSNDLPTPWISHAISRTTLQGLLIFTRRDATLLTTIKKTGIFDTMFSPTAKKATYLILENAEEVAALHYTYDHNKRLVISEQLCISRIINSLETSIQLNKTTCTSEAYLTAIALSIKIFLETVLRRPPDTEEDFENTAVQLMEVLQKPEQQLCTSSLVLCSSLELVFWQTMMGAIAAPDARTKSFYTSRLERITTALALTSWYDASVILQRFFWIPSIFSAPCYQILSEVLYSQGRTDT